MGDVELLVYDTSQEQIKHFVRRFEAQPCTSEHELIRRADVVDICTPTDVHIHSGLRAISECRAVFIEKPMASTVEECVQLIEAAEKADVLLTPGQVVRYFPEFELGNKLISEGKLGNVAAARLRRGGRMPRGAENWFMNFERSGGVLLDLAIHDFDWLRWSLGEVKHLYSKALMGKTTYGDYALTTLTFESGAIAHTEATWMDPSGFRTSYEVCGNKGMIEYDSRRAYCLRQHTQGHSIIESPMGPTDDPYYKQLRHFLDAVIHGTKTNVIALDGLMAVSISTAAIESAKTNRVVSPARHF
jgi:predicted dehydrogenase